ncbi:MAG: hypothetical protein GY835_16095 [bacterium]|nr:hypothetical protein [bacterium]
MKTYGKTTGCVLLTVTLILAGTLAVNANDINIHGSVSQAYLKSSAYNYLTYTADGSWSYSEAMLNFSTNVSDNLRVGAQLLGRDLGPSGQNVVMIDWAFGDYNVRDEFGIRAGKVKMPFGFYNTSRDVDMVRTSILLPQSVYSEGFRSTMNAIAGVGVYGNLDGGASGEWEYEAVYGAMEFDNESFAPAYLQQMSGFAPLIGEVTTESKYAWAVALRWNTPLEGLRMGSSICGLNMDAMGKYSILVNMGDPTGYVNVPTDISLTLDIPEWWVLSAEYSYGNLTLAGEFSRLFADLDLETPMGPMEMKDRRGGYYGQGSYRLNDQFELGAYYSVFYPNWADREGENQTEDWQAWQKDICATARIDITDNWLVKLEFHNINGVGDDMYFRSWDGDVEESWTMFGVKSTFFF